VTLGKDVLKHLGAGPGAKLVVDKLPDGRVQIRVVPSGKISDVFGMLKGKTRRSLSLDEIKRDARRSWSGKR